MFEKNLKYFAGLHLTGSNHNRTTLVLLEGDLLARKLKITDIFEKLNSTSMVFSDDRIIDIVSNYAVESICLDSPLTLPPCVACQREICPGTDLCDDLSLSYMQSIISLAESRKTRKKPFNPQTQRLWDVKEQLEDKEGVEPSFCANQTPTVIRAQVLQKRLNYLEKAPFLYETSIKHLISSLAKLDPAFENVRANFLHTIDGLEFRKQLIVLLNNFFEEDLLIRKEVYEKLEIFAAFISSFVAICIEEGFCESPSNPYFVDQGWVWLIDFKSLSAISA